MPHSDKELKRSPTSPDIGFLGRTFGPSFLKKKNRKDIQLPFNPSTDEIDPRLLKKGTSGSIIDRMKFGKGLVQALGANGRKK